MRMSNKHELADNRQVSEDEGQTKASDQMIFETSAMNGKNIETAIKKLADTACQHNTAPYVSHSPQRVCSWLICGDFSRIFSAHLRGSPQLDRVSLLGGADAFEMRRVPVKMFGISSKYQTLVLRVAKAPSGLDKDHKSYHALRKDLQIKPDLLNQHKQRMLKCNEHQQAQAQAQLTAAAGSFADNKILLKSHKVRQLLTDAEGTALLRDVWRYLLRDLCISSLIRDSLIGFILAQLVNYTTSFKNCQLQRSAAVHLTR